ncbi:MAG: DMT family transporter [Rhodocyclaceae bacterium]|nr:DMT family transporter [Rhodocyclaceae bacterium]
MKGFLAAAGVVLIWTGFNIVSRMGGKSALTPFDLAAMRFGVAGLLLLPFALKKKFAATWLQLAILAAFGGVGYCVQIYSGFAFAPASHAGILVNGKIPFATAVLAWAALGYRPGRQALWGLLMAGSGILLMGVWSLSGSDGHQWIGDTLFVGAAVSWAVFGLLMKHWHVRPLEATMGVAFFSALAYLPVYLLFLPKGIAVVPTRFLLLQCFYQGMAAPIGAGLLYAYANLSIGPMRASLMLALVPGLSSLAAVPLLGEPLSAFTIGGVVLVSLGAVLAGSAPAKR